MYTTVPQIANRHKQRKVICCFSDVWVWLSRLLLEGQAVITKRSSIFRNPFQKSDATLLLVQCGTHRVHGTTEHGNHIHISCTLHTHCYRDVLSLMVVMEQHYRQVVAMSRSLFAQLVHLGPGVVAIKVFLTVTFMASSLLHVIMSHPSEWP